MIPDTICVGELVNGDNQIVNGVLAATDKVGYIVNNIGVFVLRFGYCVISHDKGVVADNIPIVPSIH